jgi:hypothetical protein
MTGRGAAEVIAAVLAEHQHGGSVNSKERWTRCLCDAKIPWFDGEDIDEHDDSLRAHQADALVAEGIGVLAEAWERGKVAGESITRRRWSDEPNAPDPANPYRTEATP